MVESHLLQLCMEYSNGGATNTLSSVLTLDDENLR